ncbi:MAG: phosphoribosylaminoimidazolesuccinocarboxamide synthase [Candidatus Cloacimonetes bacterium]|jgi:phosphoribosylaminoimidazole-succinocarboxamide synthase|nr:phosphoribosylaminoimidazolesuccinocarboxamide synthase [Candidatus Cloacimonadota bacterium]MDY0299591.1 phosphoribosylaminoimidazolesuccinocarboxamide synthase [Candidatus Cloacimonadaceae bacterium]MCB5279171.1 phosphoribosylaminoimidazolesuccinocarboxamide synthase [Candidatus Cloacimonadota bacterium]MCK9332115.1 phosphoribosylaminoimidazolesuccinocarboxamide synthase [Candidatus Cloacimonadota bacterium]MDD2211049.1 phosphoribosylaminoimidazolesuccinocarboxamide synthase [Candidatus Cl
MHDKLIKLASVKNFKRGKVRDLYDLGETLLIVTSDRISAFDVVFPNLIPDKGRILNGISTYFFKNTKHIVNNHFITDNPAEYPEALHPFKDFLAERSMLVKKTRVIPFECIVRGYISGSAWKEYKRTGTVGGMMIAEDMHESQKFPKALFTPSTKANEGHDVNISYREMLSYTDEWIARFLKDKSLELYSYAHNLLKKSDVILADTKFEFGAIGNQILLIDECLTPDSSRFWELSSYEIGASPNSFDKQFIRNYLNDIAWDRQSAPPILPDSVISQTREKYLAMYKTITGNELT